MYYVLIYNLKPSPTPPKGGEFFTFFPFYLKTF